MQNDWWRTATFLEVDPRAFLARQDSSGKSGLGGLSERIGELAVPGVDAWILNGVLTSVGDAYGRDVRNFCDVDPRVGTQSELCHLLDQTKARGIRVLLDLSLVSTAQQHPWFLESARSGESAFADWYVWADPRADGTVPNNWLLPGGASAWVWVATRGQFALQYPVPGCMRLNFQHEAVQQAMLDVLRFWCDLGVSGFRLQDANVLFHDDSLRSNLPSVRRRAAFGPNVDLHGMQLHWYDKSQPENLAYVERIRSLLNPYAAVCMGYINDVDAFAMLDEYTDDGNRLHMTTGAGALSRSWSPAQVREQAKRIDRVIDDEAITLWSLEPAADVPLLLDEGGDEVPEHVWQMVLMMLKGPVSLRCDDGLAFASSEDVRSGKCNGFSQRMQPLLKWRQMVHDLVGFGRQRWMGVPEPLLGIIREQPGSATSLLLMLNFSGAAQELELPIAGVAVAEIPAGLEPYAGTLLGRRVLLPGFGVFVGVVGGKENSKES